MANKTRLLMLLAIVAEQSGEQVSEERFDLIGRRLEPYGLEAVCAALERMLDSVRRFPTVAEIKAEMGLSEPTAKDEALLLADTVTAAISKYGSLPPGHVQGALAIERALGPAAWMLVQKQGGWNAVIDRAGDSVGVLRAQLRDVAETYLRMGLIERGQAPEALPSHSAALDAVKDDPLLLEQRVGERQKELTRQLEAAKARRTLLLMQSEQHSRRPPKEEP